MTGFFEEVKRRKVYRVAAAYIIVAGSMIQIASATFPAWELPNWSLRLVIAFLLIGFPIALLLAWAYDITPQGIQMTPDTATPRTGRRRWDDARSPCRARTCRSLSVGRNRAVSHLTAQDAQIFPPGLPNVKRRCNALASWGRSRGG